MPATTLAEAIAAARLKIYAWIEAGNFLKQRITVGRQTVELVTMADAVSALKKLDELEAALGETTGELGRLVYAGNGGRGFDTDGEAGDELGEWLR